MNKLERLLNQLATAKAELEILTEMKKRIEAEVIEEMAGKECLSLEWNHTGIPKRASIVYSSVVKIDEAGLSKELGSKVWNSITKRVMDTKLLEDKVARGLISIGVVAGHSSEVPRSPYVKITTKKAE